MCALLRDRKPAKENGRHTDEQPRNRGWNPELLRSQIGPQIAGFPHWGIWVVR